VPTEPEKRQPIPFDDALRQLLKAKPPKKDAKPAPKKKEPPK
jgi:hypothetical protein